MNELNHLAIIMDGNGRWAKKRGLIRTNGHKKGADVVEKIVQCVCGMGIKNLTLYAFSTENWKRPAAEVYFLMELLKKFIEIKEGLFFEQNIRFCTIGNLKALSTDLQHSIASLKARTALHSKLNLILAINYGSKDEIIRAVKSALINGENIDENSISSHLDTKDFGDIDLLVRTGGEQRLSNFLLWQACYCELYFTPTLWPDFNDKELRSIVNKYKNKHRKFGGL